MGVGPIFMVVGHDQDTLQQGSGNKRGNLLKNSGVTSFIPDQGWMRPSDGEREPIPRRLRLDLRTTAEPQPELIHTRRGSHTGTRKARTSGFQRNLFTSLGRTRKNKGVQGTQQLSCKTIQVMCSFTKMVKIRPLCNNT